MKHFPLIFVVGPTGVGKSQWAMDAATDCQGVILNCDSLQTYQKLDVGTAKPSRTDQDLVPHFLFDVIPPGEVLTAGDYRRLALPVLAKELPHHPVLAVGGSGFYIQALEKGMFDIEKVPLEIEARLREEFSARLLPDLYKELTELDPETADDLNPKDSYRIQRALMIVRGLGRKLSDLKKQFRPEVLPYDMIKIGLLTDRETLRCRIEARTQAMLDAGLVEEVQALVAQGFQEWPLLQSVGYRQVLQMLAGQLQTSELANEIVLRTVQLAKRQMTWFQRDKQIRWFDLTQVAMARQWLKTELSDLKITR